MDCLELFKYKGSKQLFEVLFKYPKREFSINELAKTAGVPFASAWRAVRRFEKAGVVETGKLGGSVVVRFHDSEFTGLIARMLRLSVSPQAFTVKKLKELLGKSPFVKEAFLFGSVARHQEKLQSDIDVAILAGRRFDAESLVFDVYEEYGTKVTPVTFSSKKELHEFLRDKNAVKIV